jgi:hypothetical protein
MRAIHPTKYNGGSTKKYPKVVKGKYQEVQKKKLGNYYDTLLIM